MRLALVLVVAAASLPLATSGAAAGFKICNKSNERASVSIGYKHEDFGWTSEGWWRVPIGNCVDIVRGDLNSRYYYIYATGHRGGTWSGGKTQDGGFFCISKEKYTLRNRDYQKGNTIYCGKFETKKFRIVDTGESTDFTYNLTE